jgi:GR25 family glycosyltransferase involved in LPS biosynthesis
MSKKTICLTMIVKNESHIIANTLEHLWKYIKFDTWFISDTGSTDKTKEIIIDFFSQKGVKGTLQEEPWRDFGYNRTKAFEGAYKKADYAFVWDADDEIHGNFNLPDNLIGDSYKFIFGDNSVTYSRPQLFNMNKKWCYRGVLHEYAECLESCDATIDVIGNYFFSSGKSGNRSKNPNKYLDDALILEKASEKALIEKDSLYNRYIFYCACSYKWCNKKEKSIEIFKKGLSLSMWSQEKYVSCLDIYLQYEELKKPEEGIYYLIESNKYDSNRLECFYELIKYYCIRNMSTVSYGYYTVIQKFYENQYDPSTLSEKLFANKIIYEFLLPYYMIIVGESTNNLKTSAKMFECIFKYKSSYVSEWWIRNLIHNMQFCINELPDDLNFLNNCINYLNMVKDKRVNLEESQLKVIDKLIDKYKPLIGSTPALISTELMNKTYVNKTPVNVIITFTTCKRFDLFEKTINSLLHMWTDINKIDYFYCVDDNSCQRDRTKMKTLFPFIDFYMKRNAEKGHRTSMNLIYNKIKELNPKFWIHMEDDWLFFNKDCYVQKSVDFLTNNENLNIHQILYNRNYAETYSGYLINGGIALEGQPEFILHEKSDKVQGINCAYWPHYSFRPSMIRVSVIITLGNYDSSNTFFERDYADKYFDKGYKSAFFNKVCCLHTGKLTSDKSGINAYALNNTLQFNNTLLTSNSSNSTFIINLLHRTDRKEQTENEFEKAGMGGDPYYEFFEGIDGKQLELTDDINTLFMGNDFGSRRGFIGCALSHYTLWKQLVDSKCDYYTIFEDDIKLCDGFKEKWEEAKCNLEGVDVLFLGYHVYNKDKDEQHKCLEKGSIHKLNCQLYIGGFYSYIITQSGAKKLLEYIKTNSIKHGIDYLIKIVPELKLYNSQPHIVFSEWVENSNSNVDTNIQKDYSSLNIEPKVDKNEWVFHEGVDSGDGDIKCVGKKSVNEIMIEASKYKNCIAFNTLGFLKFAIKPEFTNSQYISRYGDGIYVKKNYMCKESLSTHQLEREVNDLIAVAQKCDLFVSDSYWVSPYLCGGIGNRLFQTAAALDLAKKMGYELVFYRHSINNNVLHNVSEFFNMFPNVRIIEDEQHNIHNILENNLEHYVYNDLSENVNKYKNIVVNGYRQNYQYVPKDGIHPILKGYDKYLEYGLESDDDKKNSWFIHVRLGDFKNHNNLNHITADFYYKKINSIPLNANVILFSDEPEVAETMIKQCYNINLRICKETNISVIYGLMSQCWGGAIIPNSTFSWWGAYFARQYALKNKCVNYKAFYPCIWDTRLTSNNNCNPPWGYCINNKIDKKIWDFYEGLDSGGNDIKRIENKNIEDMKTYALNELNCVAFNSIGYLKSYVKFPLIKSPYVYSPGGLYVKKLHKPPTRVKMICNWCSSKDLCKEWLKMTRGNYKWNNLEITWTDTDIDYYIIINKPQFGDKYEPEKTIVYHMEPWCYADEQKWGVKTWGEWAKPDPRKFLQVRSHDLFVNTVFWQLNMTYDEIKNTSMSNLKTLELVSSICSSKYFDPGHKKRIDFLKYLESKDFYVHIYNEDNNLGFKSYKGSAQPSFDKEKAIIPYKYYFMCENNVEHNFVTEKMWEPIMCESLCFYWGCPNINEIVDPMAFVQLDMDDFEASYNIMNEAIKMNLWETRLPYIKEAKQKILEQSFFPTLEKVLKPKIVCFIHSCHIASSGTERLDLVLDAVLKIKELEIIFINNIGLKLDSSYNNIDPRIVLSHSSDNPLDFELPTLRLLHQFSMHTPNTKILYVHTKGISYTKNDYRYEPVLDWTNYMLYFLCEKYKNCLKLLDCNDVVGCDYSEWPLPHFSGNFWWATAKYIKSLDTSSLFDKMSAEWFVHTNNPIKSVLWNSNLDHFKSKFKRNEYYVN